MSQPQKKYHIGKNGPAPCTANKRACRYGGESTHYTDLKEANVVYEKKLAKDSGGSFGNIKSNSRKDGSTPALRNKVYEELENHDKQVRLLDATKEELSHVEEDRERSRKLMLDAREKGDRRHIADAENRFDEDSQRVLDLKREIKKQEYNFYKDLNINRDSVKGAYQELEDTNFGKNKIPFEYSSEETIAIGELDSDGSAPVVLARTEDSWEIRDPDIRGEVVLSIEDTDGTKAGQAASMAKNYYNRKQYSNTDNGSNKKASQIDEVLEKINSKSSLPAWKFKTQDEKLKYIESAKRHNLRSGVREVESNDDDLKEFGKSRDQAVTDLRGNINYSFNADSVTGQGSNGKVKNINPEAAEKLSQSISISEKVSHILYAGKRDSKNNVTKKELRQAQAQAWGNARNSISHYLGESFDDTERGKRGYLRDAEEHLKFWHQAENRLTRN